MYRSTHEIAETVIQDERESREADGKEKKGMYKMRRQVKRLHIFQ
jgi:hypothetical protein